MIDFNKFFQSKKFKIVLFVLGGLILLSLAFTAGQFVAFRKARFSYRWGENYHQNFAGPRGGFFNDLRRNVSGRDFINPHGSFGVIISIADNVLTIKGNDNIEKTIIVSDKTIIEIGRTTAKISDLKINDNITVIGEPNEQGQIIAKFIRVFPAMPFKQMPQLPPIPSSPEIK